MADSALESLALARARDSLAGGDPGSAWEWLNSVDSSRRPKDLVALCLDRLSLIAAGTGDWNKAIRLAEQAAAMFVTPWRQERVGLLRRRKPPMGDREWEVISAKVPPTTRLPLDALAPEVTAVAACGAYFSRGVGSGGPWTRYLRLSKQPPVEDEERRAIFHLASGYFVRFVLNHTSFVEVAEVVVPVPANPNRYVTRMASLPDELAREAAAVLAIPMLPTAVAWRPEMAEIEMKKLHWSERRRLARQAFTSGDQARKLEGRAALLVDDVTTSGATLRACGQELLDAGAKQVVACCLAHTEG